MCTSLRGEESVLVGLPADGLLLNVQDATAKAFVMPAAKAYELPATDMQGARSKD